jgi:hypothetical protein
MSAILLVALVTRVLPDVALPSLFREVLALGIDLIIVTSDLIRSPCGSGSPAAPSAFSCS